MSPGHNGTNDNSNETDRPNGIARFFISPTLSPALLRTALIVLCFSLVCTLGNRLYARKDVTGGAIHTLKPQTIATLDKLQGPVEAEVFINPLDSQKQSISELFKKYQSHKTDLSLTFTDPALDPQKMRTLGVTTGGEIFLRYQNRTARLSQLSEYSLTLAFQRLVRTGNQKLLFTEGHGERSINGKTNADLGLFAQQLKDSGLEIDTINLSTMNSIETSLGTIVIAGPIQRFLAKEVALLLDFISRGGNLVWLTEPASNDGLKSVELELGIQRLPGVVIDMAAQQLAVERPDFAIANNYSKHQATEGFDAVTLFPQATGLNVLKDREWRAAALVLAGDQAWTESGALSGKVEFGDDQSEIQGPFPLILALERDRSNKRQRVIVAGDGDFLTDAWIGNGGNRELANRLLNWSVADTQMLGIDAPQAVDTTLNITRTGKFILAGVALLLLPGMMFSAATSVWYRRQHG